MKTIYAIIMVTVFCIACNSKNKFLANYYGTNKALHQEMAESLMNIAKANNTDLIIRKQYNGAILFSVGFHNKHL